MSARVTNETKKWAAAGIDMTQKSACVSTGVACWQGDCQRSLWDPAFVPRTSTFDPLAFSAP